MNDPTIPPSAQDKQNALDNITFTPYIEVLFNETPPKITDATDINISIILDEKRIKVLKSTMQTPSPVPSSSLPHIILLANDNNITSDVFEWNINTLFKGSHVIPDNPIVHVNRVIISYLTIL